MKEIINKVISGKCLSSEDAKRAMELICSDAVSDLDRAIFLSSIHARGETTEEFIGFLSYFRENMLTVDLGNETGIDVCGTGGDFSGTFNVSTAVTLVVAALKIRVAKHGGRSISSKSGSIDVLEELGLPLCKSPEEVQCMINEHNCAFMFAPDFNPSLRKLAELRKHMGIRSVLNLLGPLLNPARVKRQVLGVYDKRFMKPIAEVLKELGSIHVIVAHARDGLDEFSINSSTDYVELKDGKIQEGTQRALLILAKP